MENIQKKKVFIITCAIAAYLLVLNPYVIETAKVLYGNLHFLNNYLPSGSLEYPFIIKERSDQIKEIENLLRGENSPKSRNELILFLNQGFPLDSLTDEEMVAYAYQAIQKYPEEPILRWLLVRNLLKDNQFLNPELLIAELKQGQALDPEEPVFDYLTAYIKRLCFAPPGTREGVIQSVIDGSNKYRTPAYGEQLIRMALEHAENHLSIPFAETLAVVIATDLDTGAQLRELNRYIYWSSEFYLEKNKFEKATVTAQTDINLARQLKRSKNIIAVLVGQAVEEMGQEKLKNVYRRLGNKHGLEEIRSVKMFNYLWLEKIRKYTQEMMPNVIIYSIFWETNSLIFFLLVIWFVGFGLVYLFYFFTGKKSGEEITPFCIRRKTRFIVGIGFATLGCVVLIPLGVLSGVLPAPLLSISHSFRWLALFLVIILYFLLVRILAPLLVRGELIYKGKKGSYSAAWAITKNSLFVLLKWGLLTYVLLMPAIGFFLLKHGNFLRASCLNETSLAPPPYVNSEIYAQESDKLTKIAKNVGAHKNDKRLGRTRSDIQTIWDLGRVDAYEKVPELIQILNNSKDMEVTNKIIETLGNFSQGVDPSVLKPFLNNTKTIDTLGKIAHPDAAKILVKYSLSALPSQETALALALARQKRFAESTGIVRKVLTEKKIDIGSIEQTLVLLPDAESTNLLKLYFEKNGYEAAGKIENSTLRKGCDGEMAGKILQSLISRNGHVPESLIEVLSNHLNKTHTPLLLDGSKKEINASLRSFCIYMLGALKVKEATQIIKEATGDFDWTVRLNAVCALGDLGGMSDLPFLEAATKDKNLAVQAAASWSIKKLKNLR